MLRLSEIKLPLNHTENDLPEAILRTLKISAEELLGFNIYKRSYDARKKGNIMLIYQLDIELGDNLEKRVLETTPALPRVGPSPDTNYKFVAAGKCRISRQQSTATDYYWLWPLRNTRRISTGTDGLKTHRCRTRSRSAPAHSGHMGLLAQAKIR